MKTLPTIFILLALSIIAVISPKTANAKSCYSPSNVKASGCTFCGCDQTIETCKEGCLCASNAETGSPDVPETTLGHMTIEFDKHRQWMKEIFLNDANQGDMPGLFAAMKIMTSQLTANTIQKVHAIGTFFDAKHQLETQRLFQQLTARAHKDYHPSEGLCEFGTVTRSLAASGRNTTVTATAFSKKLIQRQLGAKGTASETNYKINTDRQNRLVNFITTYCNKQDNSKNLNLLCLKGTPDAANMNRDINYTRTIDAPLTLDVEFTYPPTSSTEEEKAIFALSNNLFAHSLFPFVTADKFVNGDGSPNYTASALTYMDARALMAKRSVAMNSFTAVTALKTKGDIGAQPFIYSLLKEMGGTNITAEEIERKIGTQPSYHAQMEVLTKLMYQRPEFYSDLYDKPANVMRKNVALQAATLMQKRDLHQSYLRSEMTLAVMLETLLVKEQDKLKNEGGVQ